MTDNNVNYPEWVGRLVIFTYLHGESEEGVVTSWNGRYLFVRFGGSTTSQACDPSMVRLSVV